MEQRQNFVWVSSNKLEQSMLNDCNEASVNYVTHGKGIPVLNWTGASEVRREDADRGHSGDTSTNDEVSNVNEEDGQKEIEETQLPPRRSEQARKTPVRFCNTVIVPLEDPVTYEKGMRSSKKN